ncbi:MULTISPECIES: hypothetical protein [Hymenobacter]|uniref:DUF4177 domain-containing protein n=1 Tax=Hymenobacter jejuensis TaxID=2502781 RepID=A0A5B8A2C2_9BACT|nr:MULTISPECIES: hypothetical protein [Hymenobacter]MBC6990763.1 hypothetical protein [Hymenobacter sp. BT491]QDA60835.1 hypothetical protein FHG12_12295 [Hymenobacter jejuensis]
MKKLYYLPALLLVAICSWAFYPKPAETGNSMMVISNLSFGLNAQASIVTINPDGTQQEKEIDFSRGSAKQLAANTTVVHKAALATINEYTRNGWRLVSTAPNGVATAGTTVFSQTIYLLQKQ